jgi:hypothetical protein
MSNTYSVIQNFRPPNSEITDRRPFEIPHWDSVSSYGPSGVGTLQPSERAMYLPTPVELEAQKNVDNADYMARCELYEQELTARELCGQSDDTSDTAETVDNFVMSGIDISPYCSEWSLYEPHVNPVVTKIMHRDPSDYEWAALRLMSQRLVDLQGEHHCLEIENSRLRKSLSMQSAARADKILEIERENSQLRQILSVQGGLYEDALSNLAGENRHLRRTVNRLNQSWHARIVNYSRNAWHSFVAILRHKSALSNQRKLRKDVEVERKTLWVWFKVVTRTMHTARESVQSELIGDFHAKLRCERAWFEMTVRAIKTHRDTMQTDIYFLWLTSRNEIAAHCSDLTGRWKGVTLRVKSRNFQRFLFRALWHMKYVNLWSSMTNTIVQDCKLSKWEEFVNVIDWYHVVKRMNKQCRISAMTEIGNSWKKDQKHCRFWSKIISGIVKERRSTTMELIALNYEDRAMTAVGKWETLLKDRALIKIVLFNRAAYLQKWTSISRSLLQVIKYRLLYGDEFEYDVIRNMRLFLLMYNEDKEKTQESLAIYRNYHGMWPLQWKIFRHNTEYVYASVSSSLRVTVKNFHGLVFGLLQTYLMEVRHEPTTIAGGSYYFDTVQRMYDARFLSQVEVDWPSLSLRIFISEPRTNCKTNFLVNMHTIDNIVGFYYAQGRSLMMNFFIMSPSDLPTHMNSIQAKLFNQTVLDNRMRELEHGMKSKYWNRFSVAWDTKVSNAVIIKCRIVRKIDGTVYDYGTIHAYGLYEALERFQRNVYDVTLFSVLSLEEKLMINHSYGRLLENWDPPEQ